MNKLHNVYVALVVLMLAILDVGQKGYCQGSDSVQPTGQGRIYAIQIAASKVFIDPDFFKDKFKIAEEIRYYQKDGWYKYIVGSFSSEAEALKKMNGLKVDGFITTLQESRIIGSDQRSSALKNQVDKTIGDEEGVLVDTLSSSDAKSVSPVVSDLELRNLYNLKIREADSAFNIARNLLLARDLYLEASSIFPDRKYPGDQVFEIDKLLIQNQSQSIFAKITLKTKVILAVIIGIILLIVIVFIFKRIKKRSAEKSIGQDEVGIGLNPDYQPGDFQDFINHFSTEPTRKQSGLRIDVILLMYPTLATEISSSLSTGHSIAGPDKKIDYPLLQVVIERCLNSVDEILRMEAEQAWMRLNEADSFSFLDKLRQEFTPLEQLHVYEMIGRHSLPVPEFSRWMDSPNQTVAQFSRQMIRAFKQESLIHQDVMIGDADKDPGENKALETIFDVSDWDLQSAARQILNSRIPH